MKIDSIIGSFVCVIVVVVSTTAKFHYCPPYELIRPCHCSRELEWYVPYQRHSYTFGPVVECMDFSSERDLEDVLAELYDHRFPGLYLISSTMNYIPSAPLISNNTVFKTLYIRDSTLLTLFDLVPTVENSVEHVYLENTRIMRGVQWSHFQNLRNLTLLRIWHTEVRALGASFRNHVSTTLVCLWMYRTKTQRISDDAFRSMEDLDAIVVSGSQVSYLKRSMFANESGISHFDFSENRIQDLPVDLFENMPYLATVRLNMNKITTISIATFNRANIWRTREVNLLDNPLECTCNMRWITFRKTYHFPVWGRCVAPPNVFGCDICNLWPDRFDYC